ncbi:hypothetical protein ILUMI_00241 [Ignelater luminosus]|uniref:BAT2 N-terminal domain-containing protein n=1 Tax=Ignelater luminosus TaxID=2038154 RepID=A0A8K0GLF6_IGNLU|nr:hypothetical protein ILUMI_00241 [Ignelater luminosus]
MSTLPGLASKGEKGKSKFQSLDINNLYKVYTTEPLETQQQKNTLPRKHGMQSLGKVPTARRPPANLPSLKSEHTGSDAAVSLVPSGGAGWGKQDPSSPSTTTPPSTSTTTNSNATNASPANVQLTAQPVNALPVATPIPPPSKNHVTPTATPVTADKSWSSVMSGSDLLQPPPYQSPQFQHEFPSLSAGDGAPQRTGSDTQYGPGPSLRPQTEGSWIQGGSRPGAEAPPRSNSVPLGPPPQLSGPVGPNQQQPLPPQFRGLIPPFMYRGNFAPNGHGGPNFANIPGSMNSGRNRMPENRGTARADNEEVCHRPIIREEDLNRMDDMTRDVGWASHDDIDYNQKLAFSDDETEPDKGNRQTSLQKEHDKTEHNLQEAHTKNWSASKTGSNAPSTTSQGGRSRSNEEDEVWVQRRRQQSEEVAMVIERAKQRKEEEEKRFLETKQAAQKKLQLLEEKMSRSKHDKEADDSQGTINPSVVPPQPITPVPIPVPDWEREKEGRSRTPVENSGGKTQYRENTSDFRKLTQIEGRSFVRKETRSADRDTRERERDMREQSGPSFSKQFQSNLPPRFQKQQQLRNNASSSPQPQGPSVPFAEQYDVRWQQNQTFNKSSSSIRKTRQEVDELENKEQEEERKDNRRLAADEGYRGSYRSYTEVPSKSENKYEEGRDYRGHDFDYRRDRNDDKWEKENKSEKRNSQQDLFDEHSVNRHNNDDNRNRDKYEEKFQDRFERPQRPDSRDSRTSRESRHSRESTRDSEPREYHGSWADTPFEPTYDDRRKEHFREDRRSVPGPITKERIEAEDLKPEKKNLTQLKRGYIPEKRNVDTKKEEQVTEKSSTDDGWTEQKNKEEVDNEEVGGVSKAWADAISPNTVAPENPKFMEVIEKTSKTPSAVEPIKEETKQDDMDAKKGDKVMHDKDEKRGSSSNRRRGDSRQGWGGSGGYVYHRSTWSKKSDPRRGSRSGGPKKSSIKGNEWHGTDSDVSIDEVSVSTESGKDERSGRASQRSPKTTKKFEKDEKNKESKLEKPSGSDRKFESGRRDNYVPRGEPSRHGRGAGNFRNRGGLSKRIDGYGPPPSKSPFGQHEDKDKKITNEETASNDNVSSDEKTKQNQQALSAGIIGSSHTANKDSSSFAAKKSEDRSDNKTRSASSTQRPKKTKSDDSVINDNCDTSDNSDESGLKESKSSRKFGSKSSISSSGTGINRSSSASNITRRNNPPPRFSNDKRGNYNARNESASVRQNSSSSLKPTYGSGKKEIPKIEDNKGNEFMSSLCTMEKSNKTKENTEEMENVDVVENEEKNSPVCDSDGFQEVKSKKTGQRQKSIEDKPIIKPTSKVEKENKVTDRKKPNGSSQLTPQQIANIPSLMDTPVNPPSVVPQPTNKNQFERSRQQNKLPPRFAKQRETNRLQKAQMQQGMCDINDMNKINHNINMYGLKDGSNTAPGRISNAWEKPLSTHIRTEQDGMLTVGIDTAKTLEQPQQSTSQNNSPNIDKVMKSNHIPEKTVLDGTTPPVNTIIFENTNFKSAPGARPSRSDKSCTNKLDESSIDQTVIPSFTKPIRDLLNKNDKQSDSIQMQLTFTKEDSADMKLDFFESELSHLTEDKSSKNMGLPRSIHAITSANNTISPSTADALNFKIASVKKVWESMPTVIEHSVGQEDTNSTFSTSFGADPNSLDPSSAFGKGGDTPDDSHEGYTSSPNQPTSNNTTNVCKVKPTQQVATSGQAVHATVHQQHSAVVGPGIVGHPLSPPPMQPVIGAGVGLGQPPQPYTSNQHISYQPSLGGSTQYGMSAIPSPPTVLFNSTQQIQAAQTGLYGAFQIDQTQVLGGQGRSQYSQYPSPYNLGQTASSPYSAQSMYLQGAQPHPPPAAQAPPDIYQNLNNYRLPATGPFGQSQQLNNPTTVLISSTSNSLMSATVKPSTQQISAIGTKASGAGQAYQQQSQQGQQLYMTYDPTMQANYLPSTGVMQRGPTAPIQNNVVPALQPSSSYYTGSTGGQTGFFQQPGSSTLPSAPLQQHQAGYGLQGNVFGTPNQTHTSAGLQNFGSHFLSSPMQIAAAAAINAQQYRSTNLQSSPYVKSVNNHVGDQNSRPQQIKSPGSQQDVLSSVFNSGPQIPSPKSRQNVKQPPPQPSPTAQHKYNLYQTVGNQQASQTQRYPAPIQRPVTFQPAVGTIQSNNASNNPKHRPTNQSSKLTARNYYGTQAGNLSTTQSDKVEDAKLGDNSTANSTNSTIVSNTSSIVSKAVISSSSTAAVNQTAEITKDSTKDESSVIKD